MALEGEDDGADEAVVADDPASTSDTWTPDAPGDENATKAIYSQSQIIRALRTSDGAFGSIAYAGSEIEFSINPGQLVPGQANYSSPHAGYVNMSQGMIDVAREAFALWDELIAIDLVEVQNKPTAQVTFNYSSNTGGSTYASYEFGGSTGGRATFGLSQTDLWFAHSWWTHNQASDLTYGGYGITTYLHEIGHALGLSHPGNYNGTASFGANATHFQDTRAYTLMSYFNAEENASGTDHFGTAGRSYAGTPLLHDILTAQSIYGADMTTRDKSTTYGFNATAGREAFDFSINTNPVVAIWDAGGIDKIDVSGWSTNQIVDLTAGAYSSVGHLTHNLAIAYGVTIELATTGNGNDQLIGNDAANVLVSAGGNDTLFGGAGADIFWAGTGADTVFGGDDADWIRFDDATSGVRVDLVIGLGGAGAAQGDVYVSIEHISGSAYGDTLTGDNFTNNQIFGRGGNDYLYGGQGHDFLLGHSGNDQIYGGGGRDVIRGGAGADVLHGGDQDDWVQYHDSTSGVALNLVSGGTAGDAEGDVFVSIEHVRATDYDDVLTGSGARNIMYAGGGNDWVTGAGGNDVFYGQGGNDTLIGGAVQDTLYGGAGADIINGGGGNDWVRYSDASSGVAASLLTMSGTVGDAAGDRFISIEWLWGSDYADVLDGSDGVNILRGGAGNDVLRSHGANDVMLGDGGADTFVFGEGDGIDRINGFNLAQDRIRIIDTVTNFGQLSISSFRGDAAIAYDQGDVILLVGIDASQVNSSIFTFG